VDGTSIVFVYDVSATTSFGVAASGFMVDVDGTTPVGCGILANQVISAVGREDVAPGPPRTPGGGKVTAPLLSFPLLLVLAGAIGFLGLVGLSGKRRTSL
jgi:hypothetical protein